MEVTGVVLAGELVGGGVEDDGEGVGVGVGVKETGEVLGGAEDGCGEDGALDEKSKVSQNAHISQDLNHSRCSGGRP